MSDDSQQHSLNILLITQWFDPEPSFKGLTFAKALQGLGHRVSVVTGFPNYPGGKIYPGYKLQLHTNETLDDIKIKRLFLYPSHDGSAVGRALNYCSFFLSLLTYLVFFAPRVDVIYVYHPPATVGVAAAIARVFRRTPTVLDVQDMWPDTLTMTGMIKNKFLLNFIGKVCSFAYSNMNHIVVLSNGFKRALIKRGVPEGKLTVIPNWADVWPANCTAVLPSVFAKSPEFKILFAGNMGRAQNLGCVIDAALHLSHLPYGIKIFLLGEGLETEQLKKRCADLQLQSIVFLPRVSMAEVGAYLAAADCLLVQLKADPLFAITIPSKTQAYLASGKPIIMAVEGDAADMVKDAEAGVCIKPEDAEGLAKAMIAVSQMSPETLLRMGEAGKAYYEKFLRLEVGVRSFDSVFKKVLGRTSSGEQGR
jgi:colanic acid biosynthesis glycosyl transferase WcaI